MQVNVVTMRAIQGFLELQHLLRGSGKGVRDIINYMYRNCTVYLSLLTYLGTHEKWEQTRNKIVKKIGLVRRYNR